MMKYIYFYILTNQNGVPNNGVFSKYSHLAFYMSLQTEGDELDEPIVRKVSQGYGNKKQYELYKIIGPEEELQKLINDDKVMYEYEHQRLKMNNYQLMKGDVDQCRFERA